MVDNARDKYCCLDLTCHGHKYIFIQEARSKFVIKIQRDSPFM